MLILRMASFGQRWSVAPINRLGSTECCESWLSARIGKTQQQTRESHRELTGMAIPIPSGHSRFREIGDRHCAPDGRSLVLRRRPGWCPGHTAMPVPSGRALDRTRGARTHRRCELAPDSLAVGAVGQVPCELSIVNAAGADSHLPFANHVPGIMCRCGRP